MERFISDFDVYMKSVILEAEDRVAGHQRTVNDYMVLRRGTIGAKLTFSLFGIGLNIPDAVFDNPVMISLIENAIDLNAISNVSHLIVSLVEVNATSHLHFEGYAFISAGAFTWARET
jgi:Delta6-protoilludene synthase